MVGLVYSRSSAGARVLSARAWTGPRAPRPASRRRGAGGQPARPAKAAETIVTAKWLSPPGRAPACPIWRCEWSIDLEPGRGKRSVSLRRIVSATGSPAGFQLSAASVRNAPRSSTTWWIWSPSEPVAGPVGRCAPRRWSCRGRRRAPDFVRCLRPSARCRAPTPWRRQQFAEAGEPRLRLVARGDDVEDAAEEAAIPRCSSRRPA